MSSQLPPDPFFNNINFNPSFFIDNDPFLTEAMANFLYLKLTGGNITGNLGIGTTPLAKLHIVEPTGTVASANNGTIIIDHNNAGGASSILFRSARARGNDFGYIQYQDAITVGAEGEAAKLIIGTQNDNIDDIILLPSGNVGIKATNPPSLLTVNPVPVVIDSFDFSTSPLTITNTTPTSDTAINDPRPVLHLCREGTEVQAYASKATFSLCRYEESTANSRTRLDLGLSHTNFNDVNVMSIRSDGRVGIGLTDPSSAFQIRAPNNAILRIETNTNAASQTSGIEFGTPDILSANSAKITSTRLASNKNNIQFLTSDGAASLTRITIRENGTVGIGTTDSKSLLTVNPVPAIIDPFDFSLSPMTITNTTATSDTVINDPRPVLHLCREGTSSLAYASKATFSLCRFENSGNSSRTRLDISLSHTTFNDVNIMSIRSDGRVGIGTTNPGSAFQIGNGERLRISTGNSDYTQIGTSDTSGFNNTNITISGSSRSAQTGNIEYTAVNNHIFYSTLDSAYDTILDIDPIEVKTNVPITTYGANYYTDGQYLNYQSRINTSGQVKNGYFMPTDGFYNAFINFSCSHLSPNYAYWHGHIGTNNNANPGILYISAFSTINMSIESFAEQTTNKGFIYMYPNYAYTTSGQMRVKFYG